MLEFFEKLLVKHWDGTRFLKFLKEMPTVYLLCFLLSCSAGVINNDASPVSQSSALILTRPETRQ